MEIEKLILVPKPKKMTSKSGYCSLKAGRYILVPCEDKQNMYNVGKRIKGIVKDLLKIELPIIIHEGSCSDYAVFFKKDDILNKEEYILDIDKNCIHIGYGSSAGAFHAVSTLKQIIVQYGKALPCIRIEDKPDFEVRGIMVDISRNKIPNMDTLYKMIDFMADLKLNQFQLYIEGFSFAYPSFPDVWSNGTPVTGEEMLLLDRYCKEQFIEFVPNQNSFGHMTPWLLRKEFKNLIVCPDGFEAPWGKCSDPIGLNPLEEGSIELLEKMYSDLLPYFTSDYFNVCCDETFDLGQGKSKEQCEKLGKGRVYLNFLLKINDVLKIHGKKMMIWGDIIVKYPELIHELPEDVIALEWGYDADQPNEENCRRFEESGIQYYVCPGTNTFNSIVGRTDCMKSNLLNAAELGKRYGASGYLNTEWGDGGHWQPLPANYASFCYGAALSWGVDQNKEMDIAAYLDRFVFNDHSNKMGRFVLELGNYYLKEKASVYNGSGIFRTLYWAQLDDKNTFLSFLNLPDLEIQDFEDVKKYVNALYDDLDKVEMKCEDAEIIEIEFRNSMRLILHGAELGLIKLGKYNKEAKKEMLEEMLEDIILIIKQYKESWLKRNRSGGLDSSISKMESLKNQYVEALYQENI